MNWLGVLLCCAVLAKAQTPVKSAIISDSAHVSDTFHEPRDYRVFLPPDYDRSSESYPVIYWFHGFGERFNKTPPNKNYDEGTDYGGDNIANFVATHKVIVVKWDGINLPSERPYNIGPVETDRQFPFYFLELVAFIDAHYRTIADRDHRATAGLSMGGFMSYWIAGKFPDLVSSASNFMGSPEFFVGPREFPVEYSQDVMSGNFAGVRTRLVTGTKDFIQFYHRQMNRLWTMPEHETENFDFDHGTPGMAKTLAFHMNAFANPLPRPDVWSHADVYPTFSVWGWTVQTDRHRPGFTSLQNVSRTGFQCQVREWLPGGKTIRFTQVRITTASLYPPDKPVGVTMIRSRDHFIHREQMLADEEGHLHFSLDGDEYQVVIASALVTRAPEPAATAPPPVATDFEVADQKAFEIFRHATERVTRTLGEGNGDGKANVGEQIVILFPDQGAYRAAELFADDPCLDLTNRVSDDWSAYDWVGASAKYTVAKINCGGNRTVKIRTRYIIPNKPNHELREATIELHIAQQVF